MSEPVFGSEGSRILFDVHVQPRASRTEVVGSYGTALKIRLQAPPVDGRANAALVAFLAERLEVRQQQVEIVSGHTGRSKRVAVVGLSVAQIRTRLGLAAAG